MSKKDEALKLALEALEHCKDVIVERGLNGNPEFAKKWGLALPLERSESAVAALREALAEQPAPVQGWKLVPVEPTQKMLDAPPNAYPADALVTWKAMLAAAPQPAVQQEPAWRTAGGIPRFKPAQRKPLTPQEFESLHYKVKGYVQTGLMDVVRMVEEHHGIKEKNT